MWGRLSGCGPAFLRLQPAESRLQPGLAAPQWWHSTLRAGHGSVPGAHFGFAHFLFAEPVCGDGLRLGVERDAILTHDVQIAEERALMAAEREHRHGYRDSYVDAHHSAVRAP